LASRNSSRARGDAIARNRWLVHLALIVGFLGAIISAVFLSKKYLGHSGTTDHAIIGLLVLALVIVHLIQRRQTVGGIISRIVGPQRSTGRHSRRDMSDLILWILTLNAMISGIADFVVGHSIYLPLPVPFVLQRWHTLSVLVLLVYVIVHVVRRRNRLRTSHIR
jgi:ABC-type uncharacterized transport system permease subunit